MRSLKIISAWIFICGAAFAAHGQATKAADWNIADYIKNLPGKYITAAGDFDKPAAGNMIFDERNGYAAAYPVLPRADSEDEKFPTFEAAIFKSQTTSPLLVASNRISDSVCTEYETFFLRRVGNNWTRVEREVVPPIDLKMFWDAPQSIERLLKIIKESSISYHFQPPRQGKRMKVSPEICDYLEDDASEESAKELKKLIESAKPIYLIWDKQKGKFNLEK